MHGDDSHDMDIHDTEIWCINNMTEKVIQFPFKDIRGIEIQQANTCKITTFMESTSTTGILDVMRDPDILPPSPAPY
jgi:hypothetical protein